MLLIVINGNKLNRTYTFIEHNVGKKADDKEKLQFPLNRACIRGR